MWIGNPTKGWSLVITATFYTRSTVHDTFYTRSTVHNTFYTRSTVHDTFYTRSTIWCILHSIYNIIHSTLDLPYIQVVTLFFLWYSDDIWCMRDMRPPTEITQPALCISLIFRSILGIQRYFEIYVSKLGIEWYSDIY